MRRNKRKKPFDEFAAKRRKEWRPGVILYSNSTSSDPLSDTFLRSYEWLKVRMAVLKRDGARCRCCGATPRNGRVMNVDHIKPRKIYPELALNADNLQVLCDLCNQGKGNWDMTDWRSEDVA